MSGPWPKKALDLVETGRGRVLASYSAGNRQLLNERPQGAVEMIGRALKAQNGALRRGDDVEQGAGDARLADPRFTDQQQALALAAPDLGPALAQQRKLLVASDHRAKL